MSINARSYLPKAPELAILGSIFGLLVIFDISGPLLYLLGAVGSGVLIAAYLQYQTKRKIQVTSAKRKIRVTSGYRLTLVIIFLEIGSMAILSYSTPFGVPLIFYILLILVVGLISLLAIIAPTRQLLFPIILFALILRGAYWYSAPIIGSDAKTHVAITRYIVEHGRIIPESIIYYHYYPIGHLISATVSEATGLPVRVSFFLAIGGGAVGGIAVIALFTTRLVPKEFSTRSLIFTALFLSVSHWHLANSGVLIVQSLMLLFVPIALLTVVSNDIRLIFTGLFAAMVLLLTHNAPGLMLVGFVGIMLFTNHIGQRIALPVVQRNTSQNLVAVIGISLFSYWIVTNYLRRQVPRILRILTPGGALSESASQPSEVMQATIIDLFLWPAADLLFGGVFLTAVIFVVIRNILENKSIFALDFLVATGTIYLGTGTILFIALDTDITRLVPLAILFVAPIVGYVLANLAATNRTGLGVCLVLMLILPSLIFISAVGPGYALGDAPTEYRPEFQQNWLSTSEYQGAKTASAMTDQMSTSGYVKRSLALKQGVTPQVDGVRSVEIMHSGWPTKCKTFYARNYYEKSFDLHPPPATDVILDVGDAQLYRCT